MFSVYVSHLLEKSAKLRTSGSTQDYHLAIEAVGEAGENTREYIKYLESIHNQKRIEM